MNQFSAQPRSLIRRTAIGLCLAVGLFFMAKAVTPNAQATSTASLPAAREIAPVSTGAELTTKSIEDIKPGDLVLARDEHGVEVGLKPVKEVYRRTAMHLRHLTFEADDGSRQTLSTTDEHPFWSLSADEFIDAGSLPVGHLVTDQHGKTQVLVRSTREEAPTGIPVFNFQVQDFHTYYVAAQAENDVLLVHNANCNPPVFTGSGAFGRSTLTFGDNLAKKVRKHIDQVRKRGDGQIDAIPSPRQGGIDAVRKIIQDRVAQGGGVKTTFGGQNVMSFKDGGVSYILKMDGTFWTILNNI